VGSDRRSGGVEARCWGRGEGGVLGVRGDGVG